jgi:hypothetical protein
LNFDKLSLQFSARLDPVIIPSFEERYCMNIPMTLLITTTHNKEYPNFGPAAISVSQFPGSMYAPPTTSPNPENLMK